MSMLDIIRDGFKYLDKNGLKHLIEKIKLHDVHWTGTHAEYEAVKDTIPAYAILHFTDDYDEGGISGHDYLGTGNYDVPRTITINTIGRHTLIVSPHIGSTQNYQGNSASVTFFIDGQVRRTDLPVALWGMFPVSGDSSVSPQVKYINFANVTAITQDTVTLSTEGLTIPFPWLNIFVI